ncbi:maltokinase N-terminal cap-like domain-containing protein [Streptomyces zingiberis]|uniref:maltokinase N-terminal cap-like domain-containing protein n=1 Tax=Streptomyces zingiberis TaxID=2053010 RepID=UPI001F115A69|nr:phosphotransferase [Streptomyces zingiberis]
MLPSLQPLLRAWLPRQRWFAGKGRPVTGFSLVSATEVLPCTPGGPAPGLLHLLVRVRQSSPAGADCYQLLVGVRSTLPPHLAPALIGHPSSGPLRGLAVYEALADPRLAGLLLERLRVPGRLGALRFTRAPGTAIASTPAPRLVGAEQSNSSVIYGDAYILKVFRRIGAGVNPDLELPLALARVGCDRVPHPTAWFEAGRDGGAGAGVGRAVGGEVDGGFSGEVPPAPSPGENPDDATFTLGILQPFLTGSADGWQLALRSLAARDDFTGAAHALGRATAEVHTALADALPTAVLRRRQIEHIASVMTERLEAAAEAVPALRPYREPLRAAFDEFAALGARGRTWPAQRIHGDLHLGQALRTPHDGRWSLIDFEGEPARPIADRRRLQPVARDIAGMLRSFDYAARTHRPPAPGASGPSPRPAPSPATRRWPEERETEEWWSQQWSGRWSELNRAAFCGGYAEAAGTDPREEPELLRAYETDKAVYEVLYEARHRPDWLAVPMAAIRRLAGEPEELPAADVEERYRTAMAGYHDPGEAYGAVGPPPPEPRGAAGSSGRSGPAGSGAPDDTDSSGGTHGTAASGGSSGPTGQPGSSTSPDASG